MNSLPKTSLKLTEYLSQLADLELAENHKRFLKAYQPDDPVKSMERELIVMIEEIMKDEN